MPPVINVFKAFKHADDGNTVVEYPVGEHDVSERCALVAVEHLGVAELVGAKNSPPPADTNGSDEGGPPPTNVGGEGSGGTDTPPPTNLNDLNVAQLKELLTEMGIEFAAKATKAELVALIEAAEKHD